MSDAFHRSCGAAVASVPFGETSTGVDGAAMFTVIATSELQAP